MNLAHTGELDPTDRVWTASLETWTPASEVPGLFAATHQAPAPMHSDTIPEGPALSGGSDVRKTPASGTLVDIPPGSQQLDVFACIKRGIDLTKRHFPIILMLSFTCLGITIATYSILEALDAQMGWKKITPRVPEGFFPQGTKQDLGSPFNFVVTQVLSIFICLGTTRIYLNLVSGRAVSLMMLFKEGPRLLRASAAAILFAAMVTLGLMLFVLPGIYIALRFGFFMIAIVDRNMGVLESLAYSSSITTRNRMHLFGLFGMCLSVVFAMMLFGAYAALIGVVFVMPVVWLAHMTAYRWLQYGSQAVLDHPGGIQPTAGGL